MSARGFQTYIIFPRIIHVRLSPKVELMDFWHRVIISTICLNGELILRAQQRWRGWWRLAEVNPWYEKKKKTNFALLVDVCVTECWQLWKLSVLCAFFFFVLFFIIFIIVVFKIKIHFNVITRSFRMTC